MSTPPASAPAPAAPSTPRRKRLDRDQRRDILLLRRRGDTYEQIATFLHISHAAVQYTCTTHNATPQHKKAGRKAKLQPREVDELLRFVKSSKRTRRLTYQQIRDELYEGREEVNAEAVKYALNKRGYFRGGARRRRDVSEEKENRGRDVVS